jgi:hypothetical protein
MREPVMIDDGNSYERNSIEEWWFCEQARKRNASSPPRFTSPLTREVVTRKHVVNLNLKKVIAGAVEAKLAELRKRKRED